MGKRGFAEVRASVPHDGEAGGEWFSPNGTNHSVTSQLCHKWLRLRTSAHSSWTPFDTLLGYAMIACSQKHPFTDWDRRLHSHLDLRQYSTDTDHALIRLGLPVSMHQGCASSL